MSFEPVLCLNSAVGAYTSLPDAYSTSPFMGHRRGTESEDDGANVRQTETIKGLAPRGNKKLRGTARRRMSVEILSTAAQTYEQEVHVYSRDAVGPLCSYKFVLCFTRHGS